MSTIVREEVPTRVDREVPDGPRRRVPWWWLLAVVVALVMGLVVGAAGWQATRGTSSAESTGNATTATTRLAQRFMAEKVFSQAQTRYFAKNVYGVEKAVGVTASGQSDMASAWMGYGSAPSMKVKERLLFAGPTGFVGEFSGTGVSPQTLKRFHFDMAIVFTVKNGKITTVTSYWDPRSFYGLRA